MDRPMDTLVMLGLKAKEERKMKLYKGTAVLTIADVSGTSEMVGKFSFQVVGELPAEQTPEQMASTILMKHIRETGSLAVTEVSEVPADQSVVSLRPCK